MTMLTGVSQNWQNRPNDERHVDLVEFAAYSEEKRDRSTSTVVSTRQIEAAPVEGDSNALVLVSKKSGTAAVPTHWSFGQLAQRAGAPAAYLRTLPSPLAADCINLGLQRQPAEDTGILLRRNGHVELAAVTGPNYGRIWNADIARNLVQTFGDGRTGAWRVPGTFGSKIDPADASKGNSTIFGSDRDCYVFLSKDDDRIDLPNRRDGKTGQLSRGVLVWNSEVGSKTYGMASFVYDFMCANRLIWGVGEYSQITVRHTSKAPDRFIEEATPALNAYVNSSASSLLAGIEAARKARIDDVDAFLLKRFSRSQVAAVKLAHLTEEGRPVETLWDAATGVTAYARTIPYQDERVTVEKLGGDLLTLAQ